MAHGTPAGLTQNELRRFGLTLGAALLALGGLLWWRDHVVAARGVGVIGGFLTGAGVVIPGRLASVYRVWMGLARALSKVTTPVFMAILYFLLLTPFGMVRRLFGGNPLTTHHKPSSVWVARTAPRGDLRRQF